MSEEYLKTACPHCAGWIEYPDSLSGTEVVCPHCGDPLFLGDPASESAPRLTASDLAAAFQGRIQRRRPPWTYALSIFATSIALLMLPAIYFLVVGGLIWVEIEFALSGIQRIRSHEGNLASLVVLIGVHAAVLFFGTVLLVFFLRPLFVARRRRSQRLALNPAAEPLLFAFTHMICDSIGAPYPARIEVDCRLNASAGFERRFLGLLRGDLVLCVGLPLVAALNTRELAGVLAHELGHFTQRFGLRASALIRAVLAWLADAARPPEWEQDLAIEATGAHGMRAQLVASTARFGMWLSRTLLKVLLLAGSTVSGFLLRQMEVEADRCQIELAGSDAFETTFRRVQALRGAAPAVYRRLRKTWNADRELPEDLPRTLANAEKTLNAELRERLVGRQERAEIDVFASHPANRARLEAARETQAPGIFHLEAPAAWLFSDFDVLARQGTLLHYEEVLGLPRNAIRLVPVESRDQAESA